MQGKNLPIVIIFSGVLLAGGAAFLMKRGNPEEAASGAGKAQAPPLAAASSGSTANASKLDGGHIRGKEGAKVTLVEFGDFQCPSCGLYHPIVSGLLDESPDLVKLEFHHFPLIGVHPNALPAAIAAEAAADQGRYWEMHNLLFERQQVWSTHPNPEEDFIQMAREIGLDTAKFQLALKAPAVRDRVLADVKRGNDVQVDGTPTFYVNGRKLHPAPQTIQSFKQALVDRLPAAH